MRRLGGAYGGKITQPSHVAGACAVAAQKTQKPVRLILDLQTNMEMLGKRCPYRFEYTVRNLCTMSHTSLHIGKGGRSFLVDLSLGMIEQEQLFDEVYFQDLALDGSYSSLRPPWMQ